MANNLGEAIAFADYMQTFSAPMGIGSGPGLMAHTSDGLFFRLALGTDSDWFVESAIRPVILFFLMCPPPFFCFDSFFGAILVQEKELVGELLGWIFPQWRMVWLRVFVLIFCAVLLIDEMEGSL